MGAQNQLAGGAPPNLSGGIQRSPQTAATMPQYTPQATQNRLADAIDMYGRPAAERTPQAVQGRMAAATDMYGQQPAQTQPNVSGWPQYLQPYVQQIQSQSSAPNLATGMVGGQGRK